jgi:hypothetical protein
MVEQFANAGAGLLGSVLGYSAAKSGQNLQRDINRENLQSAREFAQNSIQWKVEDAKKAGIHPLAALGTQSAYAPSSYSGGDAGEAQATMGIVSSLGQMLGTALEAIKNDSEADKLGQQDANTAGSLANLKAEDLDKTVREYKKSVLDPKASEIYFGSKSKPNFELLPINKGRFRVDFAEGSTDAERAGEGGVLSAHALYARMAGIARQAAKDAEKTYGGSWYAHQNADGSWEIINRKEKYHSPLEFFSDKYEKLLSLF